MYICGICCIILKYVFGSILGIKASFNTTFSNMANPCCLENYKTPLQKQNLVYAQLYFRIEKCI